MTEGDNVQERQKREKATDRRKNRESEGEFTLTAMIDQIFLIGT